MVVLVAQLSELAALVEKNQKGKRSGKGILKGATGSLGSRPFQGRNSDAGINKERDLVDSPILKEMHKRMQTPISDYIKRIGG